MPGKTSQGSLFRLMSAEERNRASPDTFLIPKRTTRENVKVGFLVKLIFTSEDPPAGERMWVRVDGRRGPVYRGILQSKPVTMKDLIPGEEVRFGPEHICDVSPPDNDG